MAKDGNFYFRGRLIGVLSCKFERLDCFKQVLKGNEKLFLSLSQGKFYFLVFRD